MLNCLSINGNTIVFSNGAFCLLIDLLNIEITTVKINTEGKIHKSFDNLVKDNVPD